MLHKPLSSQEIFSLVVVFADKGADFESTESSERQKQDAVMQHRYCQPLPKWDHWPHHLVFFMYEGIYSLTLIMVTGQCFRGKLWILVFMWVFFVSVRFGSGAFWGQVDPLSCLSHSLGCTKAVFVLCPAGGPVSSGYAWTAGLFGWMVSASWHLCKSQYSGFPRRILHCSEMEMIAFVLVFKSIWVCCVCCLVFTHWT